ncbi:MAG: DUF4136 domain-containing protein [Alcanivoracaceae bacterium]|nr:DUF4136 domain-containing protein [Alcanivoracaceae bacterium]
MRSVMVLVVLALVGCATPVIDYQAGTSFGDYSRASLAMTSGEQETARSLDMARVEQALRKYLPAQGVQIVDDDAQLQVVSRFVEYSRFDSNELFWGFGATRSNVGVAVSTPVSSEESKQYRLEIELVDIASKQVVWKARSAGAMDEDYSTAARDKWIDRAVQKMLAEYPPAP